MNDELETLEPEARMARDAVRALPRPEAEPAFRARLRHEFSAGTIAAPKPVVLPRPRSTWVMPLAWAAAFLVAIAGAWIANRGAAWEVVASHGEGIALIDNQPIPMNHVDELSRSLAPGRRIRVPAGTELEIRSGGSLAIQITPESDMVLPSPPARWFGRSSLAALETGELRITTGPRFRGAKLAVMTPEARVDVTGTTLAVICEPTGTCVCVLEGHVMVGPRAGDMQEVPGGRRRYVFNDGRAPESDVMRDTEHGPLGEFRERQLEAMSR